MKTNIATPRMMAKMHKGTVRPGIKKAVKTVGKVVTAPIRWAGKQVEKEMRMQDTADKKNKAKSKILNDWWK